MKKKYSRTQYKCASCKTIGSHTVFHMQNNLEHHRCSKCGSVTVLGVVKPGEPNSGEQKGPRSLNHAELMQRPTVTYLTDYSPTSNYLEGEYLSHSKFGEGYVLEIIPPKKMRVLFAEQTVLLMCGAGTPHGSDHRRRKNAK